MREKVLDIPVPRSHPDYMKHYSQIQKGNVQSYKRDWADKNVERKREQWKTWYSQNKIKQRIKNQFEKAERLKRIPSWADREAIAEFYRNCPKGYHVDHIIPLRGKTVSGLHVLENLQYLPAKDNLSKGNRYIEDNELRG